MAISRRRLRGLGGVRRQAYGDFDREQAGHAVDRSASKRTRRDHEVSALAVIRPGLATGAAQNTSPASQATTRTANKPKL